MAKQKMPRKGRRPFKVSAEPADGRAPDHGNLLDQLSSQDLRRWQRSATALHDYYHCRFHELETQREKNRAALIDTLKQSGYLVFKISRWSRIVDYRYAIQPLSAKGSLLNGGRFNIGGNIDISWFTPFPALYIAGDYNTAYAERFGASPNNKDHQPHELNLSISGSFSTVQLDGKLQGLFDLRKPKALNSFTNIIKEFKLSRDLNEKAKRIGLSRDQLVTKPKQLLDSLMDQWATDPIQFGLPSNSQIFARLVRDAGFEGILYKSTKGRGICAALFPDKWNDSDSYVELKDKAPPETISRLDQSSAPKLW